MTSTSLTPALGTAVKKVRPIVLFVLAVVVIVTVSMILIVTSRGNQTPLSTGSASPDGSRALAELLHDQGVHIQERTSARDVAKTATAGSTLVVADTTFLTRKTAHTVADSRADVVLIEPDATRLADITRHISPKGYSDKTTIAPRCPLPAAKAAGRAELGQAGIYKARGAVRATACYPDGKGAGLVQVHDGGRTITVVGSAFPFQNGGLDKAGNAALTMNLLGGHDRLVWFLPAIEDADGAATGSLAGLVPMPARIGAIGALVAVVLFAIARARRLGPVVAERLPIVVRATETTEGRARLYRSLRARERAADALRHGTIARSRPPLQLPRAATPDAVVAAVARRTEHDSSWVAGLLYGAAPPDDAALVRLADDLDSLEREIRRS